MSQALGTDYIHRLLFDRLTSIRGDILQLRASGYKEQDVWSQSLLLSIQSARRTTVKGQFIKQLENLAVMVENLRRPGETSINADSWSVKMAILTARTDRRHVEQFV